MITLCAELRTRWRYPRERDKTFSEKRDILGMTLTFIWWLPHSSNKFSVIPKISLFVLEIWKVWSDTLFTLLPDSLGPEAIVPIRIPSMVVVVVVGSKTCAKKEGNKKDENKTLKKQLYQNVNLNVLWTQFPDLYNITSLLDPDILL